MRKSLPQLIYGHAYTRIEAAYSLCCEVVNHNNKFNLKASLLGLFLFITTGTFAGTITWTGATSTDWNTASNWSPIALPDATLDVIIPTSPTGGRFPLISAGTAYCHHMTISAGATLSMTAGLFQVASDWKNSGTFNGTGGTVEYTANAGSSDYATGTNNFFNIIIDNSVDPHFSNTTGAILNVYGDITNNNSGLPAPNSNTTFNILGSINENIYTASSNVFMTTLVVNKPSGTLSMTSALTITNLTLNAGIFSTSASNYALTMSGTAQLNGGTLALNNSTISASTAFNLSGTTVTGGTPSITTGDFFTDEGTFSVTTPTLTVGGNWTSNNATGISPGAVTFTGTLKTIGGTYPTTFGGITITTGTITLNNNSTCTGLTIANNNVVNSFTLATGVSFTVNGNVLINQASGGGVIHYFYVNAATATITGNLTFSVTTNNSGRSANAIITTGTLNVNGNITMTNTLLAANSVIDMSGGAGLLYIGGNFTVSSLGTLTPGTTSTVVYNGTGSQTVACGGSITYNNLTINKASGIATMNAAATVPNLNLLAGTLNQVNALTISGNVVNNGGTLTGSPATSFTGITKTISGTGTTDFGAITIATTAVYSVSSSITGTALTFTAANGLETLNETSTGNITINGNVIVNQPTGNTKTIAWNINSGSATVTGSLTIGGSNTTVTRLSKVVITSGTLNLTGNLIYNSSASTAQTAVIDMSGGAGILNFKGSITLTNGTGTLTPGTSSTVNFNGSSAQSVTFGSAITYNNINSNNAATVSLSAAATATNITGNFNIQTGIFSNGGFAIGMATSKNFTVANGAKFLIAGTSGMVTGTTIVKTFGQSSTVEYSGTAQTVSNELYGNLTLSSSSGAAVKTMPASALTIAGNFTTNLASGTSVSATALAGLIIGGNITIGASTTFDGGSYTHTVAGNWVNNGTFSVSTSTVSLTGASTTISGTGSLNFYNLDFTGTNVTSSAATITVSGNLSTTGTGSFNHSAGVVTMSGTSKVITGNGFTFNDLTFSGTITSSANIVTIGNLLVSNSFITSGGIFNMNGTSKTISGAGTLSLYNLTVTGSVTTGSGFTISSALAVSGSLTASAGTVTFTGTSLLSGTANLFNVTLNGTSLQLQMNSTLGIAGAYTISAGTLNVTSSTPNTVNFNGSSSRTIPGGTFHHLTFTGNTNTAGGAFTVNGNLTIAASTTLLAGAYTHTLQGYFVNSGTFTAGSGTVQFTGAADASISGTTTFNNITINKSASTNTVNLNNNVSVGTINMTLGGVNTGANTLTITTTRTGAGIILGNIQRTHSFTTGQAYEFEGQANTIYFTAATGVTSILVSVTKGAISDFPFGGSINRQYTIAVTGTSYTANLRLHYETAELNGNVASNLSLWDYNGSNWVNANSFTNNTSSNYVEQDGLSSISTRWTLSNSSNVISWNGSVSTDWNTAGNWTAIQGSPSSVPSANDVVQIGVASYTNAPTITTAATAKSITFGSAKASTLTLSSGGSLVTQGNISGSWGANATHTINVNGQTLTINGDVVLSDGTTNHAINVNITTGTINITGSLTQTAGSNIVFSGAGALNIGNNFNYISGTFTPGSSTVTFNGSVSQAIAGVTYNNLIINKTGIATIAFATSVNGDLSVNGGELDITAASTVSGNVTIASGATFNAGNVTTSVGGNWTNSGSFVPASSIILLNGSGTQNIGASTFNNFTINKSTGTALLGNLSINGSINLQSGTLDLSTYTANRGTLGGSFTMANGTTLYLAGANNFPANYSTYSIGSTSTINYNGTVAQTISAQTYGNLVFTNGGASAKTLAGTIAVSGDLTINSASTFSAGAYTINLAGNWTNSGTFTASTSTVVMSGAAKTLSGTTTFNKLTISGTYSIPGTDLTLNGLFYIPSGGSLASTTGTITLASDLTNSGTFTSTGTVTFTGTAAQAIQFQNATSTNLNIVNFNGSVAPTFSSNTTPVFATLNINNTAGVSPSTGWTISTACTVAVGATFNGGAGIHTFNGSFTNNGSVSSSGTFTFSPASTQSIKLLGTSFSSTGSIVFGGTGAITVTGTPSTLTNITVNNSTGVTPSSNWTIGGTFTIGSSGIFNAGSYTYSVAGDIQSAGTLNGNTSSFTMSSATGRLSGSAATDFYDLTISGTVAAVTDFYVLHNFTNNGSFDGTNGGVIMTGSLASSIGGTATTYNLTELIIQKDAGVTATLAHNLLAVNAITINSGNLDASTFSFTNDGSGSSNLLIAAGSTLKIGGTNTLPTFDTYTIDTLSTVEYNGGVQSISAATAYGNLTISAAGNKTAAAALSINNNFTLTNGTFIGGAFTHTVSGNWNMSSGAFTNTGTTINLNGIAAQSISSTGAFNNLTINKASNDATLSTNITVAGTLTFTLGKIITGSYSVISTSGTITGAGSSTGWINGNLQRSFTNSIVTGTFPVGGTHYYTPATLTFASITAGGGPVTVGAVETSHPNLSTSGITSDKNIPTYWKVINTGSISFTSFGISTTWDVAENYSGINTTLLKIGKYTASAWTFPTISGTPTTSNIVGTGITTVGDFAVGQTCDVSATFNYPSTPYCSNSGNATISLTGGASAGTFSVSPAGLSFNTTTGLVTLGSSTAGSYTVTNTATGTGGCTTANTATIVITAAPSATISYAGSPFCANAGSATVTRSGTNGGTYSAAAGLSINAATGAINIAASTVGVYTVSYTIATANGCAQFVTTTSVTITAVPSATISYAGSPFCTSGGTGAVTFSGTGGGTYTAGAGLNINSGTGLITPSGSTPGSYTVTYTVAAAGGCSQYTKTASVTITATPSATISYGSSTLCSSAGIVSVTLTGTTGGTYSSAAGLSINSGTGAINTLLSTAGSYTITYTVAAAGGCSQYTTSTAVTISSAPTATLSYAGSPFCTSAGTGSVTFSGSTGGLFTSTAGLTINAVTGAITPSTSVAGTYVVTYTIAAAGGCSLYSATTSVTITAAPTAVISYIGSPFCTSGSTAAVTLVGSSGGSYSSTVGLSINAASGLINLASSTPGSYTVTYTVAASGGCSSIQATTGLVINQAGLWTGAISTAWNLAGNWKCGSVPTSSINVTIPSGLSNYPILTTTVGINNLTINSGASLTLSGDTLQIAGSISNSGTLNAGTGTVELNGTSAQTIPANTFASNTIYGINVNNSVSVTLGGTLNLTGILSILNGQLITGGYLILKSSANATALVGPILSAATTPISGNVTVERYIPGHRKYRMLTSSVTTSTSSTLIAGQESLSIWGNWQNQGVNTTANIGMLITGGTSADGFDPQTANASLFTYNDATKKFVNFSSANGKNTKYTPLKAGIPYYAFVYGDRRNSVTTSTPNPTVLTETGTLLTGDQYYDTTTTVAISPVVGRFSMLGNPFACIIDWKSTTKFNVSNTAWGWDANLSSTGGYVTVTVSGSNVLVAPLSGLVRISRYIQPGQSFFVKTTATNPHFLIGEGDKITDTARISNNIFGSTAPTRLMAVNLIYNTAGTDILADGAVAAFDTSYSNSVGDEDAVKMTGGNEVLSIMKDSILLSIDAQQLPHVNDTMNINITKLTKPQYTLQVFSQAMNGSNLQPFLYDAYLNTTTSLSISDTNNIAFSVNLSVPASFDANRFKLVFRQTGILPVTFNAISAEEVNKNIRVQWTVSEERDIVKYQVEHSADGVHFAVSGEVAARGTVLLQNYDWLDLSPVTGNNYYRIKSIQTNGSYIMSSVVLVKIAGISPELIVYPNPVTNSDMNVKLINLETDTYRLVFYNWQGQEVVQQLVNHGGGTSLYTIHLPKLATGTYVLKLYGKKEEFTQKVLIQ